MTKKRILLKLSGEVLGGAQGVGLCDEALEQLARQIGVQSQSLEIAIVTGGGNIMRGRRAPGIDRSFADRIGMMATVVNGMSLQAHLNALSHRAEALSIVPSLAGTYQIERARQLLSDGTIVILSGGTGNPYFSTDTAAALRALELQADLLVKATKVDGVYDRDPVKHADARRYARLSYDEVLERELGVMDLTAMTLCKAQRLPTCVCHIDALSRLAELAATELTEVATYIF